MRGSYGVLEPVLLLVGNGNDVDHAVRPNDADHVIGMPFPGAFTFIDRPLDLSFVCHDIDRRCPVWNTGCDMLKARCPMVGKDRKGTYGKNDL